MLALSPTANHTVYAIFEPSHGLGLWILAQGSRITNDRDMQAERKSMTRVVAHDRSGEYVE